MQKQQLILFAVLMAMATACFGKKPSVDRVDPPFWWVEMEMSTLELLIHGEELGSITAVETEAEGISIKKVTHFPNPNYLAVTIDIGRGVKPGTVEMQLVQGKKKFPFEYALKARYQKPEEMVGSLK